MPAILNKTLLNQDVARLDIYAPLIAAKALPGQFVIIRATAESERVPLTIAQADTSNGAVTVVVQKVGKSTLVLSELSTGDNLHDIVGPLGMPTHTEGLKKAAVVGGGLGCAIAWPITKALHDQGTETHMIAGFRNKDLVILENEMLRDATALHLCTDDGSYGEKGFVTDKLRLLVQQGHSFDRVYAIGPLIMMKFVSKLTKELGIPTVVSMNPIMVDGTGMCGACRVTVDGKVRFACVDGPDFDGHLVDFDETMKRASAYKEFEAARKESHICNLMGVKTNA